MKKIGINYREAPDLKELRVNRVNPDQQVPSVLEEHPDPKDPRATLEPLASLEAQANLA